MRFGFRKDRPKTGQVKIINNPLNSVITQSSSGLQKKEESKNHQPKKRSNSRLRRRIRNRKQQREYGEQEHQRLGKCATGLALLMFFAMLV